MKQYSHSISAIRFAAGALLAIQAPRAFAQVDQVAGNLLRFNDNGTWCWYQDERVIFDGNRLLVGSIANGSGAGISRAGDVDVVTFDLATRKPTRFELSTIQADDHNTSALLVRPDGKYLALYANHGSDNLTRYRVSTNPGDASTWTAEQTFNNGVGATYSNTFFLPADGKTYNFSRTVGYDPNFLVSSNYGSTWNYGGYVLKDPAGSSSGRPYVKYASNGTDRVYFLNTENHPRNNNNSIYCGYLSNGLLYKADGTLVGSPGTSVETAPSATQFSLVAAANGSINGEVRTHFWTTDLAVDSGGNPYAAFTSRVNSNTSDHRLYYGKWTGSAWDVHEVAKAGSYLYAAEDDYTGLIALDPDDPNTIYISTKIHPLSGVTTGHYEIYKGATANGGANWNWTAITSNSSVDNIRPVVPKSNGANKAVLWSRGIYSTYTNYDMAIVGLVDSPAETVGTTQYVDATVSNTTRVSGSGAWNTGPATGQGAADNLWHRRTGFGNGGELLTADENTAEDVPMLKTTVNGLSAGQYDVFAFFWGNPNEHWQILAGLDSTNLMTFEKLSAEHVTLADIAGAGTVNSGASEYMYKAYLGRTMVDGSGQFQIFVDDNNGIGTSRVWYDGAGYALVSAASIMHWTGAGSNWASSANWVNGVPNRVGTSVQFGRVGVGNRNVQINGVTMTVSAIRFDDATGYSVNAVNNGLLKLQAVADAAHIDVVQGSHTINSPLAIAGDLTVSVGSLSNLSITVPLAADGKVLTKTGLGAMQVASMSAKSIRVNAGSISVSTKAQPNDDTGTSLAQELFIAPGSTLDLKNNAMVYRSSSSDAVTHIRQMLDDGRISSSLATSGFAIGYARNTDLGLNEFAGLPVLGSDLLLAYALTGDANLDGRVNTVDFNRLAGQFGAGSDRIWHDGDFDYSGTVDSTDFALLAGKYGGVMSAPVLGASVPEPAGGLVVATLLVGLLPRRRAASNRDAQSN